MIIWDEFYFIRRVGTLYIIFNDVMHNAFIGFASKGELVNVEHFMGCAILGERLRLMGRGKSVPVQWFNTEGYMRCRCLLQ